MAIFGDLADLPPQEIFAMLGQRSGRLQFQLPHRNTTEVHLHKGTLLSLHINGYPAHSGDNLEIGLKRLLNEREGSFEFSEASPEDLDHQVELPRQKLLQLASQAVEESQLEASEEAAGNKRVPDKDTRFEIMVSSSDDLPNTLRQFMNRCSHLLKGNASAAEIADALGMPLVRVQLYLSLLRSQGKVSPVRAYSASVAAPPLSLDQREHKKVFAHSGPKETTFPAARSAEPPAKRGFVRRLLAAITSGGFR